LSAALFDDLASFIERLVRAAQATGEEALLPLALAEKLAAWCEHLTAGPGASLAAAGAPRLEPGEMLIYAPGSVVVVPFRGELLERCLLEPQVLAQGDSETVMYRYESSPGVQAWVPHAQLQPTGQDWRYAIWSRYDGQIRDLEKAA